MISQTGTSQVSSHCFRYEDERYAPTETYSGYSSWETDYRRSEYYGRSQCLSHDGSPYYGPDFSSPHHESRGSYPDSPMPLYPEASVRSSYPGPNRRYGPGMEFQDYRKGYDYSGDSYMDSSLFPPPPPPPPPRPSASNRDEAWQTPKGQDKEEPRDFEREEYEAELRRRVEEMEAKVCFGSWLLGSLNIATISVEFALVCSLLSGAFPLHCLGS